MGTKGGRENNKSGRTDRRWFMRDVAIAAIGYLIGASTDGTIHQDIEKTVDDAYIKLGKPFDKLNEELGINARKNWDLIRPVFGPFGHVVLCPGTHHPTFKWHHDSNWRPAGDFASLLKQVVGKPTFMVKGDEEKVISTFGEWDKVTFGSPVSNMLAAQLLGYQKGRDGVEKKHGPRLRWEYNCSKLHSREPSWEYVFGKKLCEPNWEIHDCVTGKPFRPAVHSDGGRQFLDTDYLLITKLRDSNNHVSVCIGGTHGISTRQFERVLSDSAMLKDLHSKIMNHRPGPFQALFQVSGIEHDHATLHTDAASIDLIGFEPLEA